MLQKLYVLCLIAIALIAGLATATVRSFGQAETLLYNFQGQPDGSVPSAHLIRDSSGNLYGTTAYGGANGYGSVFKIDNKGNKTTIYSFTGGPDGGIPVAALIRDSAGNLYGTTEFGGGNNGVIFKIGPTGKETVLHSFNGTSDGAFPLTGLLRDASGNLYGTTSSGGNTTCISVLSGGGCGTLFRLSAAGKLSVIHTFGTGTDGSAPAGDLIGDSAGNLYGTTYAGGAHGYGSVYKVSKGLLTILYSFNFGAGSDGARPLSNLLRDAAGNLYGTTRYGGFFGSSTCQGFGCGTVFEVDPNGTETVLYSFTGNPDGNDPRAGLVMDSSGNLYGTTAKGGSNSKTGSQGTVFRLTANGEETVLHSFGTGSDAYMPLASLIPGTAGAYYGTASQGGSGGAGVVFKIVP